MLFPHLVDSISLDCSSKMFNFSQFLRRNQQGTLWALCYCLLLRPKMRKNPRTKKKSNACRVSRYCRTVTGNCVLYLHVYVNPQFIKLTLTYFFVHEIRAGVFCPPHKGFLFWICYQFHAVWQDIFTNELLRRGSDMLLKRKKSM